MHSHLIAPHVQAFFAEYLCQQKRLSPQTIVSCRDTFRLLLTFLRDQTGIEPSALRIADIDAPVVLSFLHYLEHQRGNSVRSRNIRLSAIRSFFRLVALREPDSIGIITRVLAIPMKREDRVVSLHTADKYHRLTRRLSQDQKVLEGKAIMVSQQPSAPW
jgi:integrase/recombinase XerD